MNFYIILKVCLVIIVSTQCFINSSAEEIVDSPLIKEVEQKKALYYNRKPPQGKNVVIVPKKQMMKIRKVIPSNTTNKPYYNNNGGLQRTMPMAKRGPGPMRQTPSASAPQLIQKENDQRKSTSIDTGKDTQTASERTFFPPYKFPFWGMPYGIYSNGGFINPGLFPFVPGGPGFPPYDGIFGSPFGPGLFPGKQNPIPPGVGTPMVPSESAPVPSTPGQPPLNPTGNRRGAPPGAFSPGSPYGYRRPKRPKPKPKPKPEEDEPECPCSRVKDDDYYYYYPPPRRPSKKAKATTPAPCPCSRPRPPPKAKKVVREEYDDEDEDEGKSGSACPFAHEPETPATTTPAYAPPPQKSAPTTPAPPVYAPETPAPGKKTRLCKLKHKTKATKSYGNDEYAYITAPVENKTPVIVIEQPPPPPPVVKTPCPLKSQEKRVEYVYITPPPASTTAAPPAPPPLPQVKYEQVQAPAYQSPATYQAQAGQPGQDALKTQPQPQQYTYQTQGGQQVTFQAQTETPIITDPNGGAQPVTLQVVESQPQTPTYQQQGSPATYQSQVTGPKVVYSSNPQPQSGRATQGSNGNHNTILYKPANHEIIHTPTSVTVPLPLPPFMIDENGNLLQQGQQAPSQNPQQVTYNVDLSPDLLTKITTPVVTAQSRQASSIPIVISQNPSTQQQSQLQQVLRQIAASGRQIIIDGKPVTIVNTNSAPKQQQMYPQSRVLILDASSPAPQPSPVVYSSSPVVQPSVVVVKSEPSSNPLYDLLQGRLQQAMDPQSSYIQTQQLNTGSASSSSPMYLSPSMQSIPDYNFLVSDPPPQNVRSHSQNYRRTPYPPKDFYSNGYSSSNYYADEAPYPPQPPSPRRPHHSSSSQRHRQSNYNTKDYVVIDRDELEELKKTITSSDQYDEDKNLPPPPSVIHIERHIRNDANREDFNGPLSFSGSSSNSNREGSSSSFSNHRNDYSHYNRNYDMNGELGPPPSFQQSMASLFESSAKDNVAQGSMQFSKIFDMNNEDIRGIPPSGNKKKKKSRGTLMVFDKYLENSDDTEDK